MTNTNQTATGTQQRPTVGFIGLGDQGLPMAVAIAQAGFELHVWARRAASLEGLAGVPYTAHGSVAELAAAAEVIGICVPTDEDVQDLIGGDLGSHARPGTVLVNHGTGTPRNARAMAAAAAEHGLAFLDAPVSGGRLGAEAHTLTTLVGGPQAVADRAEPVFRSFSEHIVHLGDHGAGQIAKLFNNALLMMNQASIADLLELAVAGGVDPIRAAEALKLGSGSSKALELMPFRHPGGLDAMAAHLSEVELLDMELFGTAMSELDVDAAEATERGRSGARRLGALTRTLNP